MRGGLDRLQKEIDALTYNSRTILNALIRSTVVSGSSQGYTANRAGVQITLDRIDIYRLYRFYQQWEINEFATETTELTGINQKTLLGFDELRLDLDSIEVHDDNGNVTLGATTTALVKHAKLLYLNADTMTQESVDDYWLGLIRDSNNPKLVSNSSPIPLNLRTPVFDENLATTRYNQNPTYLFPNGYYLMEAFGYAGDGVDHRMDGNSWTIAADDSISIESSAIALGGVYNQAPYKTKARRNGDRYSNYVTAQETYSTAWGFDTHARGMYSTAGGVSSMVPTNAYAAIAIGNRNLASNNGAAVVGGVLNTGSGEYIGILGGEYNTVIGDDGATIGGTANIVGSQLYDFGFPSNNVSDPTCVISADDCTTSTGASEGTLFGRHVITILGNVVTSFAVGDIVRLFNFTVSDGEETKLTYRNVNGEIYKTQDATITSVEFVNPDTNPDNINANYTIITLNVDVDGVSIVDGGKVARLISADGEYHFGLNSVAMGANNIANGQEQTVLGHYNYIEVDARLIVGNGTSSSRSNALAIYDDAVYLNASKRNGTYDGSWNSTTFSGMEMYTNRIQMKTPDFANFRIGANTSYMAYGAQTGTFNHGLILYKGNSQISTMITGSGSAPIVIKSGLSTSVTTRSGKSDITIHAIDAMNITGRSVAITGYSDGIQLMAPGNNMSLSWGGNLQLSGNTFGALPTNSSQMAHYVYTTYASTNLTGFTYDGTADYTHIIKTGAYSYEAAFPSGSESRLIQVTSGQFDSGVIVGYKLIQPIFDNETDNQHLQHVKFNKSSTGTYSEEFVKTLAWEEDRVEMGKWYDLAGTVNGISSIEISALSVTITDSTTINNIVKLLRYTYINDTCIMSLRFNFNALKDEVAAYAGEQVVINLKSTSFKRGFQSDSITPGAWDTDHDMGSINRVKARVGAPRRILIDVYDYSSLFNIGSCAFVMIEKLS